MTHRAIIIALTLILQFATSTAVSCPKGQACDPLTGTSSPCGAGEYSPLNDFYCHKAPPSKRL